MKFLHQLALCVLITLSVGCGKSTQSKPGEWFERSTGQALPEMVSEIAAEAVTVFLVGDTYYVKLKAGTGFTSWLKGQFSDCDETEAMEHLEPPEDWMEDLPFWDVDEARAGEYYQKRYESPDPTYWMSYLSHSPDSGMVYFVGVQIRQ